MRSRSSASNSPSSARWRRAPSRIAEALTYLPQPADFALGPDEYLDQIARIKAAVSVPVIGSLNGITEGGWLAYARLIEQAGADGLELNLYELATDLDEPGEQVERRGLASRPAPSSESVVDSRRGQALALLLVDRQLLQRSWTDLGVDALVLFNRFYQPDIDVEQLEVVRVQPVEPGGAAAAAALAGDSLGQNQASLAATGGVHTAIDAIKAVMAGAHGVQMVSALLERGPGHLRKVREDIARWLEEHEYESLRQMQGSMNLHAAPTPMHTNGQLREDPPKLGAALKPWEIVVGYTIESSSFVRGLGSRLPYSCAGGELVKWKAVSRPDKILRGRFSRVKPGAMRANTCPSVNVPRIVVFLDDIALGPGRTKGFIVNLVELCLSKSTLSATSNRGTSSRSVFASSRSLSAQTQGRRSPLACEQTTAF